MKRTLLITLLTCTLSLPAIGANDSRPTVSIATLLREMTDRSAIARWPDPAYTCRQASSYERLSVSPEDKRGWFANKDHTEFLRSEMRNGREEFVMMEADGPGAIVRFWMTFAGTSRGQGTLRVYIDDYDTPAIEGTAFDVLSGGLLAGAPLSTSVSELSPLEDRGHNLYFPIPYARRCKVTYQTDELRTGPDGRIESTAIIFYNINYRTYTSPVTVVPYSARELKRNARLIEQTNRLLAETATPAPPAFRPDARPDAVLAPGESRDFTLEGPAAVSLLGMRIQADDQMQALRSTAISISFDGEQTVWAPVGDFFTVGYHPLATKTWYTEASADGMMVSRWVMPFAQRCTITLTNLGQQTVTIDNATVRTIPWQWDERSMHFGTTWQQYTGIYAMGDEDACDLTFARLRGRGVYAGDGVAIYNTNDGWWGEGDEKIYVDGERFPSHFGTGSEDYYGYAWCRPEVYRHPFIAQPSGSGNLAVGYTQNTRVRALDAIPFTRQLDFDMELFDWSRTRINYAPVTFWYMLPGGEHRPGPSASDARERVARTPGDVFGSATAVVIEGEGLLPVGKPAGHVEYQNSIRNLWSGGIQLYWRDAKPGDRLETRFDCATPGTYACQGLLTVAPDYGTFNIYLNGELIASRVDLYHLSGVATRPVNFDRPATLREGENRLAVEVVACPDGMERCCFGLDKLTFGK